MKNSFKNTNTLVNIEKAELNFGTVFGFILAGLVLYHWWIEEPKKRFSRLRRFSRR